MKRIILCSDGTGNSGGKKEGTNVWKMFQAVDRNGTAHRQIPFYDDGVGTSSFGFFKAIGGAFGWGLSRNIRELYLSLVKTYSPGDRIYLFGFSRGAFTVRSLAGMIHEAGILDRGSVEREDLEDAVGRIYKAYRRQGRDRETPVEAARRLESRGFLWRKKSLAGARFHTPVEIEAVGVWDTVDAIGVPSDTMRTAAYALRGWLCRTPLLKRLPIPSPHVHDLTPSIVKVFHALAIDDERGTFAPVMFDEGKIGKTVRGRTQRVEQVWFPGVHSNVGGGYPKEGLSNIALFWMMKKVSTEHPDDPRDAVLELKLDRVEDVEQDADPECKLYDSRSGFAAYYRYKPRNIGDICADAHCQPRIHVSAFDRLRFATAGYAPVLIPQAVEVAGTTPAETALAIKVKARLQHKDPLRMEQQKRVRKWIATRKALYATFLVLSLCTAAVAIALAAAPEQAGDRGQDTVATPQEAPGSWVAMEVENLLARLNNTAGAAVRNGVEALEDSQGDTLLHSATEGLGTLIHPMSGLAASAADGFLPGVLDPLLTGILAKKRLVALLLLIAGPMLWLRQWLMGRTRHIGDLAWAKHLEKVEADSGLAEEGHETGGEEFLRQRQAG